MATTINSGYANSPKLTANIADHADVYGGRSLVFDGVVDRLSTPNITTSATSTYSFWINLNSVSGTQDLFTHANIYFRAIDNELYVYSDFSNHARYDNVLVTGSWNHIAWVANGSTHKVYINGEELTPNATTSSAIVVATNAINIGSAGNPFAGKMADFKYYHSALSESDVQSLYKKPESVPSPSTLVAWYPMCESNPESPQSIVYDHSEKKLSVEKAQDNTFSNTTNSQYWHGQSSISNNKLHILGSNHGGSQSGNCFINQSAASNAQISSDPLISGRLYKLTGTVTVNSLNSGEYIRSAFDANYTRFFSSLSVGTESFTKYIVSNQAYVSIQIPNCGADTNITIDAFSVKEVLIGNHAQTNFFGDELITNGDFASDANWTKGDGWSIGSGVATSDPSAQSATSYLKSASFTALSTSKTYRLSYTVVRNAGTIDFIGFGGSDTGLTHRTASGTYSEDFVPSGANTQIWAVSGDGGFDGTVDNVSLKEVGISSSGFETAVNEPVVPQVPLMKSNQIAIFDGVNDYVLVPGGLTGGLEELTISVWARKKIGESVGALFAVAGGGDYAQWFSATQIYWNNTMSGGMGSVSATNVVDNGKMNHYVFTTKSGEAKIYQNGILLATSTSGTGTVSSNYRNLMAYSAGGKYHTGDGNEFAFFTKVLNQAEVIELFNDGIPLDATTSSKASALKAYWRNDGITTWKNRADNFATFNGANDVITRNAINVDYKSLSIWIRPSATITTSSSIDMVMTMFDDSANSFLSLGSSTGSLTGELITLSNSTGGQTRTGWSPTGGETIPNDSWTHIGLSWDGSKYIIFYNGQPQSVSYGSSSGHVPLANNDAIRIGTGGTSTTDFFGGDIANVAIWSESLTDAQMLSVYNSGHNGDISSIQSSDLKLYYTFNPNALTDADTNSSVQDRSGNNNDSTSVSGALTNKNGTVQGTPDSITIREGLNSNRDGLGFYFTNPDSNVLRLGRIHGEYLDVGSSKSLDDIWHGGGTVELWVKPEGTTHNIGIMHKSGNGNQGWMLKTDTYSSGWHLRFSAVFSGDDYVFQKNSYLKTGVWTYIAVTYNSNAGEQATVYTSNESGVLSAITSPNTNTTSTGTYSSDAGQDLIIGSRENNGQKFDGVMDEIRIYNRALSASEITKNFKHQKGKHKND